MARADTPSAAERSSTAEPLADQIGLPATVDDIAFVAITLLMVPLVTELLAHSGAFWRDEVSTILLARAPSWTAMIGSLAHDSFPALFASLLRLWIASGLGATDTGMQLFGGIIAVAIVPALWVAASLAGMRAPVVALALVAWNPVYLYWGTSIRAYALAAVLVVLLFGLVFALVERPTATTAGAAVLTAIAAAQSNYQASYLIFAVCVAGAVVCGTRGAWRWALVCLGAGGLAALSLVPYLAVVRAVTAWNVIVQEPVTVRSIARRVASAVDAAGPSVGIAWRILLAGAVVSGARVIMRGAPRDPDERLRLYGALVITIAVPTMFVVVKSAGYGTQAWYYIPALALAALATEAAVWGRRSSRIWIVARLVLAGAIVGLSVTPLRHDLDVRRTNMDLIAGRLNAEATEQDLVLVNPFWCGVSFSYYYRGRAPWLGLPAVAPEQASNPYPVVREAMTHVDPLEPTLARVRATLERGGRVWFVGGYLVPPGGEPLRLQPAPDPRYGWSNGAYADAWSLQAGAFVRTHAQRATRIPIAVPSAVNDFENLALVAVDGWRP